MVIVAGIDPGKTGALAILWPDNAVDVYDVPLAGKPPAWSLWAQEWGPALALAGPGVVSIEDVHSMPGQGVSSTFNFGETLGFAHALVLAWAPRARVEWPTPSLWMRKLALQKAGDNGSANREEARRLMPCLADRLTRVKDHGRAEAALIAYYTRKFLCS